MIRVLPVFLLCVGCGLSDYEKRMDTQRERLKHFDEETKLLDEPLEMPKLINKNKEEIDGFPFEIFLRPPMQIRITAAKEPHVFDTVMLFRYPGGETGTMLLGASLVADKASPDSQGDTPEEFQRKTLGAFREYHRKMYTQDITPPTSGIREVFDSLSFKGPWPKMEFDRYEFIDKERSKSHAWIYFHRKGPYQVAIIYQVPIDQVANTRKAQEYSVKTLAIEGDKVAERKDEYNLRAKYKK